MRTIKDEKINAVTKKAWELNWEDVSMDQIMEIFKYHRVKKQMEIFTRVLPKNEKILEGGCGLAPYLIRLRQLGFDVEGIDYNEAPLKKAHSYDSLLPLKVGDVNAIPYPDESFGGYISLGVIEHFTEGPLQAIREARRILKKGGVLIVMVPQNHFFMRLTAPMRVLKRCRMLRRLLKKPEDTYYWEQYFRREELVPLIEREGFAVKEIHPMDHSHAFVSFSDFFRDKGSFDEASPLAIRLGEWCNKNFPWLFACQLLMIGVKK